MPNGKVILGNIDGDINVNELTISDDSYTDTSLMYIKNNSQTETGIIKAKSFNLINSKIGAIMINSDIGTNNIEIISRENLKISQNEFLKSFVISGAEESIIIASGAKYDTNITKKHNT